MRLVGRLGALAPSLDDPDARWLRERLLQVIGEPSFGLAERASAVTSLLELLLPPPAGGSALPPAAAEALAAEERVALRAIGEWLNTQPAGWRAVPLALRERYHEAVARDDEAIEDLWGY